LGFLFKFIAVGILNTIVAYFLFIFFLNFFNYSFSLFFSNVLGIIFNYFSYSILVFKSKKKNGITTKIKFLFLYLIIYIVNLIILYFLQIININLYIGGIIIIIPSFILSFLLQKYWIFK
jgi:putative flippase GtrA